MAVRKPITNKGIYFVIYTCYKWLPLNQLPERPLPARAGIDSVGEESLCSIGFQDGFRITD
jgi:hypothetical protein